MSYNCWTFTSSFFGNIFFSFCFSFLKQLWEGYRQEKDSSKKRQIKYFFIGFFILVLASVEYLPAYKIPIPPIGYFCALVALLIFSYVISRGPIFTNIIFVESLSLIILTVIISDFLISPPEVKKGKFIFYLLVFIALYLLVKGTHISFS